MTTTQTYSIERDLHEAEVMAEALVPYVYENELYGHLDTGSFVSSATMPSLTLGALLMRLQRLNALASHLDSDQQARLQTVTQRNQAVLNEWRVHYEGKLVQEAESRLRQMMFYIEECGEDLRICANTYTPEAMRRTVVEAILKAMREYDIHSDKLKTSVARADSSLRRFVYNTGVFIWPEELKAVYPADEYWWLYNQPKG